MTRLVKYEERNYEEIEKTVKETSSRISPRPRLRKQSSSETEQVFPGQMTHPMCSICLLSAERLQSKNKLKRSEKMRKERKRVKQDKIIGGQPLSKAKDLQFLLKGCRRYSEPYPLSCIAATDTAPRWKRSTTCCPHALALRRGGSGGLASLTPITAGVQPQLIQGIRRRDGVGEGQETTA